MNMIHEEDLSFKTAKTRKVPSKPIQLLAERGLLKGRKLDYGCGKGTDAQEYGMTAYDPHFNPVEPTGDFDTITCIYVLNTIHPLEGDRVLAKIKALLKVGGFAYIAVRRDVATEGYTRSGTFQRNVKLPLPIIYEDGRCCVYKMKG
jgi:ATP adenylyltransferase